MNTTIRTKIYTAISCVMGTAALCTALSTSVEAEDAPSKTVRFNDLDITKSDGAKVLYSRIRAAARDVCDLLAFWHHRRSARQQVIGSRRRRWLARRIDGAGF
jgi:UrcA family protein